ncbi:MAG: BTAD domain-containing putative transcriptional regulator [Actinomycetota bacterium]
MDDRSVSVQVRCSVLGPLRVQVGDDLARLRPGHPERLLALLLAAQGDFVSVDQLVDRLWDGQPPSAAVATLHSHVRAVRGALGPAGPIIANQRGRGYRVRLAPADPDGATLDLLDFRAHVGAARQLVQSDEIVAARAELQAALACWHGPGALPELADDLDARSLVVELASLREWAEQQAVDLVMRNGDPATVVPELEAALAREPTDQRTAAQLMRAYASSGRPERASAVYGELVRLLRERSGDVPLPELAELDGQILRHDPEVVGLQSPAPSTPEPSTADPSPPAPRPTHAGVGLGAELTSFVGRDAELVELSGALDRSSIVTLVGAGGCGKTRLAREVARQRDADQAIRLAQLADCPEGDAAAVNERLARAWGVEAATLESLADAVAASAPNPSLLVLDNCEHVLDQAALAVVMLVERVPDVRVLVTSREALHLPGERIVPLPPLPTGDDAVPDGSGPSDGARLFVERAVDAGWKVDASEVLSSTITRRAVERICRRLDGLPLAIELVAPLASLHTLDELEERLAEQPDVDRTVRSPHLRQRTLGEIIDWSVSRLTEHEHAALLAASAFAGPFTREAFASVADATFPSTTPADWPRLLDALVARSLLSPVPEDGVTRFRLLETIRAFTRRLARDLGLDEALAAAHARHHAEASTAGEVRSGRAGPDAPEVRSALLWAIDVGRDDLAIQLLDGVGIRMYRLALPATVVSWLERLGAGDGPHAPIALDLRATHALFSGDYERVDRIAGRALAALREAGDGRRAARASVIAGFSYVLAGRNDEAAELIAAARTESAELDDDWLSAWADAVDGLLARRDGRLDEAEAASARALSAFSALGDRLGPLLPTLTLGRIACARGDVDGGVRLLDRAIEAGESLGDRLVVTLGHAYAARVLLGAGRVDEALDRLVVGLVAGRSAPNRVLIAALLEYAAGALTSVGDDESAARLVGAAQALRPTAERDPLGLAGPSVERLGSTSFELAVVEGAELDRTAAIDLALERLAMVRSAG